MENRKFCIGDIVAYGTNWICTIEKIENISMATGMPEMPYYVLKPESKELSTVYVPVNNEKLVGKIRETLSKDQIENMINSTKGEEISWSNDRRSRNENFHSILSGGVQKELLLMINCIRMRKKKLSDEGKKLPATDSTILKQAEKLVNEEFSRALDIDPGEVREYIKRVLGL